MGLAKNYLLAYNAALIFGWAFVLTVAAKVCVTIGPEHVYQNVEVPLLVAQTAAVMEVIHAIFGIARSPVMVTAMQVSSRLMVVWGVLYIAPPSRAAFLPLANVINGVDLGLGLPSLLFAWGITEVVRYSFYFFKLLGSVPHSVTWMRYTFFIVLYPLGVASELFLTYSGFPHPGEHRRAVLPDAQPVQHLDPFPVNRHHVLPRVRPGLPHAVHVHGEPAQEGARAQEGEEGVDVLRCKATITRRFNIHL
jgi:hypothetical protein